MGNSTNSDDKPDASASGNALPSEAGDASHTLGPSPYSIGDIVLANHKGCFYEAKVEKIEQHLTKWMFYIHYRGWKKHWDEWMDVDRMLEYTEENLQKTRLDKKDSKDKNVKAGRISQIRAEKLVDKGGSGKKQVNDNPDTNQKKKRNCVKVKDSKPMEKGGTICIPPALRKQLIDDFEFVKEGKLVQLPRSPNVDEILTKYRDYRKQKDGGGISESVEEILNGLHTYFDKALPVLLLYNKERQQYEQAIADNISPSKLYGAEHLLRLFVKLPALLESLNLEEDTMTQLQQKLQELLRFLRKNHDNFFLSSYPLPENSETPIGKDDS